MTSGMKLGCTHLPIGGLEYSFFGDLTDGDRAKPVLIASVLKDFFIFVALLVPYRDEKLSDGRCCRENILIRCYSGSVRTQWSV